MKFKKVMALTLAGAMAFSLAACGGDSSEKKDEGAKSEAEAEGDDAADEGSEESGDGTELSVSIWDANQEPGINEILADFTAETGIKTKLSVVKWDEYWTMLEAGAQGGALPDVFWMHSNESERYMSNGMLLDVTDKIAESELIDPANYPEDIWGLYTYEDKYYAVPKDIDTIALWYNKTMFDEAGMEYPTADWTWDDMFEAAKKLTKDDGSQYGIAIKNDNNQAGYYNMVYDNGGYIINDDKTKSGWDDPKTIEAMEDLEECIKAGSMPSLEIMSENGEDVLFQSGKVAMVLQGSWMVAAFRDNEYTAENCDLVELPKSATTGRRASIYNGLGWAASANGEHTEEAWKLLEYLGSEKAQIKQAELGVTMSAYTGTSDAWAKSADFNLQAYLNMMDDLEIRPYSRNTVTWENANKETMKKVYMGEMTMAEGCAEMAQQMNEQLAEEAN
ncbi:MAG: sugar ABC transporter substrate-binding protein [Clostridiales bacterium]|nr:sugar ABC transporter substrate-binding protein [Clostridiales bacterium]